MPSFTAPHIARTQLFAALATSVASAMIVTAPLSAQKAASHGAFHVASTTLAGHATIPTPQVFNAMGCTGQNVSPELHWTGAPAGTKSFAVTAYDPDAPTGSGWWHWVAYDIPATVASLPAGAGKMGSATLAGGGTQGRTDFGQAGYGGPCPPKGDKPHHYYFTVYALDTDHLGVPGDATAAMVGFNLHAHTLAKSVIMARYGR